MAETKERFLPKFLRDAVLTIVGGLVIEPTLHRVHFDVGPYLPQIWLGISGFITLDALWRSKIIREWAQGTYRSFSPRNRKMSYLVVSAIGAICFCLYWFAINRLIGGTQEEKPNPIPIAPAGFISFLGQVIDGYAPMMQENQTDTPLDDVHLSIMESTPKSEAPTNDNEWGTGTVVWQKEIEVGTCRAKLTAGLPERFLVPSQPKRLFFLIVIMTRLQTYTETIKLTKTSEREYSAELDFKSGGAQPLYTRMMTVGIASLVPHKAPESAVPRLKEGPDPFGEFDNAQFIEIGKQHIAKMEGAFERWQGQRDMPIRDSLGIDLYKSKGKPFFEFC